MAVKDIFKFDRKTFFNPKAWMDWDRVSAQNQYLWGMLKNIFTSPAPKASRSFEEAMQEYQLTEADVADAIGTYRALALIFLIFGVCAVLYAAYLLLKYTSVAGAILSLAVAALLFSQTFKYDFWAFQMRRRHLGLTFADWKRQYLSD